MPKTRTPRKRNDAEIDGSRKAEKARDKRRDKRLETRRLVEGALVVLGNHPAQLVKLLKKVASLAKDAADVLEEAEERSMALKVRGAAVAMRGLALLPASMRIGILRKLARKVLDRSAR